MQHSDGVEESAREIYLETEEEVPQVVQFTQDVHTVLNVGDIQIRAKPDSFFTSFTFNGQGFEAIEKGKDVCDLAPLDTFNTFLNLSEEQMKIVLGKESGNLSVNYQIPHYSETRESNYSLDF